MNAITAVNANVTAQKPMAARAWEIVVNGFWMLISSSSMDPPMIAFNAEVC